MAMRCGAFNRWAARRGIAARLDGIDLNPWATRAAREATEPAAPITYRTGDVFAIDAAETFDFIISSQFTHHLTDGQIVMFIRWMEAHARRGWFIGDLHRHWLPYYGFGLLAWLARWHHFVLSDGRISIARAFVPDDWRGCWCRRPALRSVTSLSPGICRSGSVSRGIVRHRPDHRRRASGYRRRHHACPRGTGRDADRARAPMPATRCAAISSAPRRLRRSRNWCRLPAASRSMRCGWCMADRQRYHAIAVRRNWL